MNNEKANFYMMPGDPKKKLDTPGGFSYKATSTMNKLGFGPLNDGHLDEEAGMNYGKTVLNEGHEGDPPMNDGHTDTALLNLGFIKAETLKKNPNAKTMMVDGEEMPITKGKK